jgi:hypothetical protein
MAVRVAMPKPNPNLAERNTRALTVACPFCRVGVGMRCWTTRSRVGLAGTEIPYPHQQRVRASWRLHEITKNRV